MKKLAIFLILCNLLPCAFSRTIYVDANGTGDYPTIQAAIDDANNGDVVILRPGTYIGDGNRDIDFLGKAITVKGSTGDPNDCIINCQGTSANPHRGFKFISGEDANSIIESLTITNGFAPLEDFFGDGRYFSAGGAVYCKRSSPIINNCIFINNLSDYIGGGICNYESNSKISNCTISGNAIASFGGGISNANSNPIIRYCTISENSVRYYGGGIYNSNSNPDISYCLIRNNASYHGGGIYNTNSDPIISNCNINNNLANGSGGGIQNRDYSDSCISNCNISNNSAEYGGGIGNRYKCNVSVSNCTIINNSAYYGGGICNRIDSSITITNNILWDNLPTQFFGTFDSSNTVSFSNIQGGHAGIGNIDADPCFVDPDVNDYHLLSDSLCINTGDPNYILEPNETDLDGNPRISDGRIDMGCYEFQSNNQPIAVAGPNQVVYVCADDELTDVNLDGSGSYDDNNDILDYYWSWVIDGNVFEANGVSPTIQLPVGEHEIELIVDDGIDYSDPDYCTITVEGPMHVKLFCKPWFFNTQSRRRTITAMVCMPEGISPEDIDANEPLIFIPGQVESTRQFVFQWQKHGRPCTWIIAAFDKDDCMEHLSQGMNRIKVVGKLNSGQCYYGNSSIYVFKPRPFRRSRD